jgi:hypothetical protein
MRTGIKVDVSGTDRNQLEAIVADRNAPQKHVWRARIVLLNGRRLRHGRDHAQCRCQQDGCLALAGTLHDRWCRWLAA